MRIAFLATGFPDYSVEAASALAQRADVLLLGDGNLLARDSVSNKRQAFTQRNRLRSFRQDNLPKRVLSCATVLAALVQFGPDAVIMHEHAHPHIAWMHRQIARLSKSLLIVHDPVPHTGRDGALAARNARCILEERSAASGFLVHGAYCASVMAQHGQIGERSILNVPHGPVLRPALQVPATYPRRALMFGRMEAYKGLDLLLAAFRIIKDRGVDCDLRLAGDGPALDPLKAAYQALGKCGIRSGFVPRRDAIAEFSDAGFVVAPYSEATQSGVVAAAFANGRPVIATAVGGLPDFIHHDRNGLLVPPHDPVALADAIQKITEEPELLARLSAGAAAAAATEMSWDRFAHTVTNHIARWDIKGGQ